MNLLRAVRAAFLVQWKEQLTLSGSLAPVLSAVAIAIGVGWIVGRSDNQVALSYVFVGAPLMGLWQMGAFRVGFTFEVERFTGTLDLVMATQTPIFFVIFAKTLAIMVSQAVTAVLVLAILLAFSETVPSVHDTSLLIVSGLLAIAGVITVCFAFSPLLFLVGGRAGFFNALMPMGTVLSGFIYPTGLLPDALEAVARILPTTWAMDAVVRATNGTGSDLRVAVACLMALLLSAAFLLLTALMFRAAERRVKVSGGLATF